MAVLEAVGTAARCTPGRGAAGGHQSAPRGHAGLAARLRAVPGLAASCRGAPWRPPRQARSDEERCCSTGGEAGTTFSSRSSSSRTRGPGGVRRRGPRPRPARRLRDESDSDWFIWPAAAPLPARRGSRYLARTRGGSAAACISRLARAAPRRPLHRLCNRRLRFGRRSEWALFIGRIALSLARPRPAAPSLARTARGPAGCRDREGATRTPRPPPCARRGRREIWVRKME